MNSLFRVNERQHGGLILMAELAAAYASERALALSAIAERMNISPGYLEEVAGKLKEAGLIVGRRGPGGGYRLTRHPDEITVAEIVTAIEGPIALVDCQKGAPCPVEANCRSKHIWNRLRTNLVDTLNDTKLSSMNV